MYKLMVDMPSLEKWERGLKIFDGAPTLTIHVNHLPFSYTIHAAQKYIYIVQQTTHLQEARVNVKVAHARHVI